MGRPLPWPLPALMVWAGAWVVFLGSGWLGLPAVGGVMLASAGGVMLSMLGGTWWRRAWVALGFPLSLVLSGSAAMPAWAWLLLLALCLLIYPLNAWRDAPLFPTPDGALRGLMAAAPLKPDALILDAGCGLGHGLQALRTAYPLSCLHGLEWSWPLWAVCAMRCPWARVRREDIWQADWAPYAMVYLFQRPESMQRALEKAEAQLQPGAWMVSLEFEVRVLRPDVVLSTEDGRPIWLYRAPFKR